MELENIDIKDDKTKWASLGRGAVLRPAEHQPSKAEQEKEIDMPSASRGMVQRIFFRPSRRCRDEPR